MILLSINKNKFQWAKNIKFNTEMNEEELAFFTADEIENVLNFQKTHRLYTNTPMRNLSALAKHLDIESIHVKDESYRFGLNAFKVMGGIYAIAKYLADKLDRDVNDLSFEELQSQEVRKQIGDITFISATDGNHGRGIAWAARELGQKSVIYMPKGSLPVRLDALKHEGAYAKITDVNYDETVRICADLAEKNNWVMVQDTAWEGYDEIPLWIMQGYSALAHEMIETFEEQQMAPPTHLFLQAGVGSFAAGIAAYFKVRYKENAPTVIIVEPHQANCYYRSFESGTGDMEIVTGDMNTIMAGLACGEPNTRAYRILGQYAKAAFSCDDSIAALGMRVLGNPLENDHRVISGESGAAPLGLVYYLKILADPEVAKAIGLDQTSRVAVISTEGDTDPEHYQNIVWRGLYPTE
ncbi:diaminopropionate ammonia-lyase [Sporosarcina sp. P33]|uniref:diaminopropionate ammonia-lyase n=1 Tax=Sporosarcina sp. P33 TaxID=1930764 RepID=UPI001E5001E1|nr:diaminopropionate ammonia-lyase [Sporosarcina sp. P33]